jgi:tripartite-type tricarboxylate transporter receptor subunit TctC
MVPAGMPAAAVQKLHAELTRIIRSPEVRERLVAQGAEVHTMTSADTAAFFEKERKHWAQVVAQGGVKAD